MAPPRWLPAAAAENSADKSGAKPNPYQKYIEVAGVRFVEDKKDKNKTLARFVLINHSEADISGLAGNLTSVGPHREIGRGSGRYVRLQHQPRAVRIQGSDRAARTPSSRFTSCRTGSLCVPTSRSPLRPQ